MKNIAPTCFIYDVDLNSLAEKHELGGRDDLGGRVDILPVKHPRSVLTDLRSDESNYGGVRRNDMKNKTTVLDNVMRPATP